MDSNGSFLQSIRSYLISYFILIITLCILQLGYSQDSLFLWVNTHHSIVQDQFFYWITYYGDGLFFVVVILGFAFYSYRFMFLGLISFLGTSIIAQLLKRLIFEGKMRPYYLLGDKYELHIPAGVETLNFNSLPSGHTTTAFALSTLLVLLFPKRPVISFILLLLATFTAYSRVYLTHHFFIDVTIGSVIGVLGTLIVYWWLNSYFDRKFGQKSLLNR